MGGVGEPGLKGDKVIGTLPYCLWVTSCPCPRDTWTRLAPPLHTLASTLLRPLHLPLWLILLSRCVRLKRTAVGGLMVEADRTGGEHGSGLSQG